MAPAIMPPSRELELALAQNRPEELAQALNFIGWYQSLVRQLQPLSLSALTAYGLCGERSLLQSQLGVRQCVVTAYACR